MELEECPQFVNILCSKILSACLYDCSWSIFQQISKIIFHMAFPLIRHSKKLHWISLWFVFWLSQIFFSNFVKKSGTGDPKSCSKFCHFFKILSNRKIQNFTIILLSQKFSRKLVFYNGNLNFKHTDFGIMSPERHSPFVAITPSAVYAIHFHNFYACFKYIHSLAGEMFLQKNLNVTYKQEKFLFNLRFSFNSAI